MELAAVESLGADLGSMLDSQRDLFCRQVEALQKIVVMQCRLTGVNPLSQEMAAGSLSINIGKRPRDLLNPKAVKYMQSVFSIKDSIGKKESREISALCGITVTQVREYFAGQRSGVRKYIRLSREKAAKTWEAKPSDNCIVRYSNDVLENSEHGPVFSSDTNMGEELPGAFLTVVSRNDGENINHLDPANSKIDQDCSLPQESIPVINFEDKKFLDNIFSLMRKEQTFSGQTKLLEWILQINNSAILYWFLTKGGATILASWLNQSALEEQTSMIFVIFKVLCHLPLHKALPEHLSSILQTVNKLRFYRMSDISNKARFLLSRWSKWLVRSQAVSLSLSKPSGVNKKLFRKQRISEILGDETWETKVDMREERLVLTQDSLQSNRQPESGLMLKLLPAPCEDSSKKNGCIISATKTKERRKVLLVEQPDGANSGRSVLVSKAASINKSRPLSADDIHKEKMRAFFMQQGKHTITNAPRNANSLPSLKKLSAAFRRRQSTSKTKGSEDTKSMHISSSKVLLVGGNISNSGFMFESSMEVLRSIKISWQKPPEMRINKLWSLGYGENSKEDEVQATRIRREQEEKYPTADDIPENPKEPWDMEMDFDDSLTPQIPAVQFSEGDDGEAAADTNGMGGAHAAAPSENLNTGCSAERPGTFNSTRCPAQAEHLNAGSSSATGSMPFSSQTEHVSTNSSLPFHTQSDNITVANKAVVSSTAFLSQIESVNEGYTCVNNSARIPAQIDHLGVGSPKLLQSEHARLCSTSMSLSANPFASQAENIRMVYSSMGYSMAYPSRSFPESMTNHKPFPSRNEDPGMDNSNTGNFVIPPSRTENASTSNPRSILPESDGAGMDKYTPLPLQNPRGGKVVGPDIELLAVLLKNPDLVFALTSGRANGITDAQTVALLDMLKKAGSMQNRTYSKRTEGLSEKPEMTHLLSRTPPAMASSDAWTQQSNTVSAHLMVQPHSSGSGRESSIIHASEAEPFPYLMLPEVAPPVQRDPLPSSTTSNAFVPVSSLQSSMSYDIPIHHQQAKNLESRDQLYFVPQAIGNLAVSGSVTNGSTVAYCLPKASSTAGYSLQETASKAPSNFAYHPSCVHLFPVIEHPASLGEPARSSGVPRKMFPAAGRTSAAILPVADYFDGSSDDCAVVDYDKSRLSPRRSRQYDYDQHASQPLPSPSMHYRPTVASSIDEYDDCGFDREEAAWPSRRYGEDDHRALPRRKSSGWDDHRQDSPRPHYHSSSNRRSPGRRRRWRDRDRRH